MDIFVSETSLNPFDKAETHDDVGMGETFAQTLIIYEKKVAALVRWIWKKNFLMAKMAIWKFFQFVFRPNSRLIKHMTKKVSCVTTTALFYDIHRRYYYDAMNVANTIWNWLRICFFFPSRTWCPLLVSRSRRENCESKNLWWVKLIIYC